MTLGSLHGNITERDFIDLFRMLRTVTANNANERVK